METLCPESGLRIAPHWPKIQKMTTTSQFSDTTSTSIFFDVFLFLLSSLVTGPRFWNYENFPLWGTDQKSGNRKYPCLSLGQYLETGQVMDTTFDTNVSNRILLNTPKFQCYSFYRFWVIKGKPTGLWEGRGGVKLPPSTRLWLIQK